jgi:hypothetical protein
MRASLADRIDRFNQRAILGWDEWKMPKLRRRYRRLIAWAKRVGDREANNLLSMGWLALEAG